MKKDRIIMIICTLLSILILVFGPKIVNYSFLKANVSRNRTNVFKPRLVLDSKDLPHISWNSIGYFNSSYPGFIDYVRFDGKKWVNFNGEKYNKNNSEVSGEKRKIGLSQLLINKQDNIIVSWVSEKLFKNMEGTTTAWGGFESFTDEYVGAVKRNWDLAWYTVPEEVVLRQSEDGTKCVLSAVKQDNSKVLTYLEGNLFSWKNIYGEVYDYKMNNGVLDIATNYFRFQSLELDSKGNPNILWVSYENNNGYINFIKWNGENWETVGGQVLKPSENNQIISDFGEDIFELKMKLDKNDNPIILFAHNKPVPIEEFEPDFDGNPVSLIKFDGEKWVDEKGRDYDFENPSIIFNMNSFAGITLSLELDSNDNPHVTWDQVHKSKRNIYYIKWGGSNWVTADGKKFVPAYYNAFVTRNKRASIDPIMKLDSKDFPHIVWIESNNKQSDVMYVRWDGSSWVTATGRKY